LVVEAKKTGLSDLVCVLGTHQQYTTTQQYNVRTPKPRHTFVTRHHGMSTVDAQQMTFRSKGFHPKTREGIFEAEQRGVRACAWGFLLCPITLQLDHTFHSSVVVAFVVTVVLLILCSHGKCFRPHHVTVDIFSIAIK
jgi:hypothetical protein